MLGDTATAVLDNWQQAPIDDKLREALRFLDTFTLEPTALAPEDFERLRAQGLSDAAIEELIEIGFLFNVIDRLADAFDFHLPNADNLRWTIRVLTKLGYAGLAF